MAPKPGDVLVWRPTASVEHMVGVVPNPPLMTCANPAEARFKACALAEQLRVDVWHSEDHIHFLQVGSYRRHRDQT
jgi:hypothetical protein